MYFNRVQANKTTNTKTKNIKDTNQKEPAWLLNLNLHQNQLDPLTNKGFTDQEEIQSVNLIHMNGRIYDPRLGRFLSPDPYIQDPSYSQSLNRYTYCMNNPLALTDPTGFYSLSDLTNSIGNLVHDVGHAIDQCLQDPYVAQGIGIAIGVLFLVNPLAGGAAWAWLNSAIAVSLYSGIVTNQNGGSIEDALKSAAISFVAACAFKGIGAEFGADPDIGSLAWGESSAAHGLVGGGMSLAEGGNFGDGFLSAAVTAALPVNDIGGKNAALTPTLAAERTGAAAVIGGTVAAAEGGNFADGAKSAAYGELFNYLADAYLATGQSVFSRLGNWAREEWNDFSAHFDFSSDSIKNNIFVLAIAAGPEAKGTEVALESADKLVVESELSEGQATNLARFESKLPKGAESTVVRGLPSGGKAFQARVPGRVPGSSAVYEKQVDYLGKTLDYTKTTYSPEGNIIHIHPYYPPGPYIYPGG